APGLPGTVRNRIANQLGNRVRQQDDGQSADGGESGVFSTLHAAWTAAGGHVQKSSPGQKQSRGRQTNFRRGVEQGGEDLGDRRRIAHAVSFRSGLRLTARTIYGLPIRPPATKWAPQKPLKTGWIETT